MHLTLTLPAPDLLWNGLKWLVITVMWCIFAYGTWREGKQLKAMRARKPDAADHAAMLEVLHQRNLQMGVIVLLLLIVTGINDMRREAAISAPVATNASTQDVTRIIEKDTTAILPLPSNMPFADITEFDEKDSRRQAYLDWMKDHYENWLVTYYYLQRCGEVTPKDMDVIRGALSKELDAVHAEASVEDNIIMAANGSYNEMYRTIPCDKQHMTTTRATYQANMLQLEKPASGNTGTGGPETH